MHQMQVVLDQSSLHNVVLFRADQIIDDKLQMVRQDPGPNL